METKTPTQKSISTLEYYKLPHKVIISLNAERLYNHINRVKKIKPYSSYECFMTEEEKLEDIKIMKYLKFLYKLYNKKDFNSKLFGENKRSRHEYRSKNKGKQNLTHEKRRKIKRENERRKKYLESLDKKDYERLKSYQFFA